jgi:U3 small nucleolar RNA-associated protein 10
VHPTPSLTHHLTNKTKNIAFWRDDRLQQVLPVLVPLVAHPGTGDEALEVALVALADAASDEAHALLKRLNMDVLMHTRSEDARVRIFALRCARAMWVAHGSKLVGTFFRILFV